MKLLMVGAPGVGKGTQAKKLSARLNIPHVSTGDLLRWHVAKETSLGLRAKEYMDRGELVPHIIGMVQYRLDRADCGSGFILDGYPRRLRQAKAMEDITEFDRVISLSAPASIIVERLSGRRLCKCSAVYHLADQPPQIEGVCDKCGEALYQREDDKPEAVQTRLELFKEVTHPLVEHYSGRGIILEIDGSGSPEEVEALITEGLDV